MKRDEEAILCYDMAIKLNPSYDNAYNNKGSLFELFSYRVITRTDWQEKISNLEL